jgi:predicted alpha-1,2-mannosidase
MRLTRIWIVLFGAAAIALAASPIQDATRAVNVFIGTGGHGHTYPGATVPFGMVQLSPDTYNDGWDWCSGYHHSDNSIMGFSHTHLSGTGIGDMLDVLLMPGTGPDKLEPGTRQNPAAGYRSRFSHAQEAAQPGYYSVVLSDYGIKAELTATERAGIHRYTFPQSDSAHFIVDLAHMYGAGNHVMSSDIRVEDDRTIVGGRRVGAWAKGRQIFFVMKFSKPFLAPEIVSDGKVLKDGARQAEGGSLKCLVHFKTEARETIYVKVGISGVSVEGAMRNLEREIPGWTFDAIRRAAHEAWSQELSKVTIETASKANREIFYTALYHTMLAPTLFDDVDRQYRGMDGQVHQLVAGQHNYSTFSLWDTYRALDPLNTIIQPARVPLTVNCLIRMAEESPQGMPVWPLQGVETGCMTGYHSASVIAEACVKGFKGIDYEKAYALMRKRAMTDDYRGLGYYRQLGYIPSDREAESATKTMEYSYDDWAVAQVARALGRTDDYRALRTRAANYRNLWDKGTGFIRPRLKDGGWAEPFDPTATGVSKNWRDFTESNSWQGTFAAQQDPHGYIDLLGGPEAFVRKLDELFTIKPPIKGEVPLDMTGLVGMYAHGNEPSHHLAYLYDYAGAAHKTQARVRDLLEGQYHADPDGIAGNEDCGQMSAWYVISALGFYAVDPVSGNYVIGSPLFAKATITLPEGRKLVIEARGISAGGKFVQSVTLNGKPLNRVWFAHSEIVRGGTLVFQMGTTPNREFGSAHSGWPPSLSDGMDRP